ncbi:hypothetical protein SAMN02745116_01753 [Pilibacter termitis]|uniref:Uncharacterized protein n=1 Tax=Pilibacter termitis TaxID=263852 RepID=A0A1T4PEG9_9ENTE|nr:hypothetical protein [Pilibacter termitis]SJZ89208.1 hypothetical protein SAMN02745116_01753 [Pilibacter termitis]
MRTSKTHKPLDELLESTGLKYEAIANKIGINIVTLYKWRINPKLISAYNLGLISESTGINFLQLFDVVKNFGNELDKSKSP